MKRNRAGVLAVLAVLAGTAAAPGEDAAHAERMRWFRHDKFGMFIHWGPYSLLAGEWKGQHVPVGAEAEWIMHQFNIPVKDYREMARQFRPVKFDAEAWVALAKAAGMKYLVLTAKHHDGFAMYRSRVSSYNIVDWTGFGRDPAKELSEACRKAGIRFCVYYSHREDWDHPDGYGNNWDYDRSRKNFGRYLEEKSKPQLRELLTNYGPLGLVWFDRGIDTDQQAAEFVQLVRTLQPQCLINGRVGNYGHELLGDYQNMGDNGMPAGGLEEDWETPQTLNTTWGYSRFDQEWKPPAMVIRRLVEIASKGGNYLLNIGPTGDGTIPPPTVATLQAVGRWMRINSESIYGTSACPAGQFPWGRCTVKEQKVYLHVFDWPGDGVLRFSGLTNQVRGAYLLTAPQKKLAASRERGVISVTLPAARPDENDTVVVLEVAGRPQAEPRVLTQSSDSAFGLDAVQGTTAGQAHKRFNRDGGFHVSDWRGPQDSITWHLLVSQTGRYRVTIRYAAKSQWARGRFLVAMGERQVPAEVQATGEWYQYKSFDLGTVEITKAGEYRVSVRPAAAFDHNLMYFQSLELRPIL